MRISCPGFARILDAKGRYALLVNKKREGKGRRVFTPIGGALQLHTPTDMQYLIETFGAKNFENGLDLRFQVPDSRVPEIEGWIRSPLGLQMRETSAAREVAEELVDENRILTLRDLNGTSERFGHFCYYSAEKQDFPEPNQKTLTRYIVEVYDWTFATAELAKLQRAAEGPNPRVYFASEAEIRRCRTNTKEEIGDISKALLR